MADVDIGKVKRNVAKLVDMGAPETDIDAYIAEEGTTIDAVKAFKEQAAPIVKQSSLKTLPAALRAGASQGVTMGFGDELKSLAAAGTVGALNLAGADTGGLTAKDAYGQAMQDYSGEQAALRESNPWAYGAGEIGGAVLSGLGAGGLATRGAAKYAPQAAKAISGAIAGSVPARLAAGGVAGGVSGGLYGLGTGEGGIDQRLESAKTGGLYGLAGGVAGSAIAPAVAKAAGPLAQRASRLFSKGNAAPAATAAPAMSPSAMSGAPAQSLQTLDDLVAKGDVLPLPKGAATGDVNMMRAEEAARQGLLGQQYQSMIGQADDLAKKEALNVTQALAGGRAAPSEEILQGGIKKLQTRAEAEKKLASKLMDQRNDKIARASIYRDYTRDTLGADIKELVNSPDFKVNLAGQSGAPIKEKVKYLELLVGKKAKTDKPISFAEVSAWRRSLNNFQPGTQEGVLAGQMAGVYDNWLDNITREAFKNADDDMVEKIFEANKNYRVFKEKYGTNKYKGESRIIQDILQKDALDASQRVNLVFGKNIGGKDTTPQVLRRALDAMPEGARREALRGDFRDGLVMRSLENAYDSRTEVLNMGVLKNSLIKLADSPSYKKYLSTPEHKQVMENLIRDLDKYVTAQSRKDVYSPSGGAVLRGLEGIMNGLGFVTGPIGGKAVSETVKSAIREGKLAPDRKLVEKSLADLVKASREGVRMNSRVLGGAAGGVVATPDPLRITVRPSDANQEGNQ